MRPSTYIMLQTNLQAPQKAEAVAKTISQDNESPEETKLRERFTPERYSMRAADRYGPDDIIPEESGLYSFPKSQ
jgi:hypothetical protein